jgi:hypothetical protein
MGKREEPEPHDEEPGWGWDEREDIEGEIDQPGNET